MTIPARLIGYGAYNLCFDAWLGKPAGGGPIFFKYLRDNGWPVNLVKVICFRNSNADPLPINRRVPLYNDQRAINTAFIDNLNNLVDQARQFGFWVQVCIFHFQAINSATEAPENRPSVLNEDLGTNPCERLKKFFSPNDAAINAEQIKLVQRIGDRLRIYDNVLWEIGNELRIQGCPDPGNAVGMCQMVTWMNKMRTALITSLQGRPYTISTSTGLLFDNEKMTFHPRPIPECAQPALPAEYFDFHKGQCFGGGNYIAGITAAKTRALTGTQPYNPRGFLIINDDGAGFSDETPDEMVAHAALIKAWACKAFASGLHYSSKQQYPPVGWDIPALQALKEANAGIGCP
ncbi:MAG TPA: hypothetical protein VF723_16220 [Pyrinomonadaceae bacterium]|jgi:hypothetical protein